MEKPNKYYLEIQARLNAKNNKEILHTLSEIKQTGQASIIPLVVRLLDNHTNDEVHREVIGLLGQLKEKEVIPYIINELRSEPTNQYRTELIMTCWQSGLDYSEHIYLFVEAFIYGDFQTAIESFSVIEEWIHNTPKDTIEASKELLLDNLKQVSEEKKSFYLELIKLVESYL
jgi:hypothetical protein